MFLSSLWTKLADIVISPQKFLPNLSTDGLENATFGAKNTNPITAISKPDHDAHSSHTLFAVFHCCWYCNSTLHWSHSLASPFPCLFRDRLWVLVLRIRSLEHSNVFTLARITTRLTSTTLQYDSPTRISRVHKHSKKQTKQAGSLHTVDIQTSFHLIFVILDLKVASIQSPHCADCWYSGQFSSHLCPLRLGGCANTVSSLQRLTFKASECSY